MGHKFEIFSAGCELCQQAIDIVKNNVCEDCEIVEYDLQSPLEEEVKEKLKKYDVMVVPTIIVDEKHKFTGNLTTDEIRKIIASG